MSLSLAPFTVQLPAGYGLSASGTGSAAGAVSPASGGVVSLSNSWNSGAFTTQAGDTYRLNDLFQSSAPTGQSITGYRVALGSGGQLMLNGVDVSNKTSFTASQFGQLTFVAGAQGSQQTLTVAAQTGKLLSNGTVSNVTDSQAVQITAGVTGTRSINAMNALATQPTGSDANTVALVQEAGILTGIGASTRPTLNTDGNFTTDAADTYRLDDLFSSSPPTGQPITGYRVALDGGGQLMLNGVDVSTQTSFTASQFGQLTFVAGAQGSQQTLTVAAQTGKLLSNGNVSNVTDSQAVQITAGVTGTRSINAMNALATQPTGSDANTVALVQEAGILTGTGAASRPTLSAYGNFFADAGDIYRLDDLFSSSAPNGQSITGYRVALDGGGQLMLNGVDVSDRTSFTAAEFGQLTFVAGAQDSQQTLTVAAQTGKLLSNGTVSNVTDSQPVQITAGVTGTRSINAMSALVTQPTGSDANTVALVQEAGILTGTGASTRPTLGTDGNFTTDAADTYRLGDLFQSSAPTGQSITGYGVALDGGGQLMLNGVNVSDRTSFTATEFAQLTFVAGAQGSQQTLTVAAQTGKLLSNGTVSNVTDSQAVQITAGVTGSRSINAMNALATQPTGSDANTVALVQEAGILTGTGASTRPTLSTYGNFSADAGDIYRLDDLFSSSPPTGQSITGYRVALGGGGQLMLNGVDVSDRTSFTATEFAQLTFVAGPQGSQQTLTVAAQTGKLLSNGNVSNVTDSQAVQITAGVTGIRSINAMSALVTQPTGSDANTVALVQEAGILTGTGASARPTLQTAETPDLPITLADLSIALGSYQSAGAASAATVDLSGYDPAAVGNSATAGNFASPTSTQTEALLLLNSQAEGAFQVAGLFSNQSIALKAYASINSLK